MQTDTIFIYLFYRYIRFYRHLRWIKTSWKIYINQLVQRRVKSYQSALGPRGNYCSSSLIYDETWVQQRIVLKTWMILQALDLTYEISQTRPRFSESIKPLKLISCEHSLKANSLQVLILTSTKSRILSTLPVPWVEVIDLIFTIMYSKVRNPKWLPITPFYWTFFYVKEFLY